MAGGDFRREAQAGFLDLLFASRFYGVPHRLEQLVLRGEFESALAGRLNRLNARDHVGVVPFGNEPESQRPLHLSAGIHSVAAQLVGAGLESAGSLELKLLDHFAVDSGLRRLLGILQNSRGARVVQSLATVIERTPPVRGGPGQELFEAHQSRLAALPFRLPVLGNAHPTNVQEIDIEKGS